jgi:hypothetical protein
MKTPKLILDYSRLNDPSLTMKAHCVIEALTGNLNFPILHPSLVDFTTLHATFEESLMKATSGDRVLIAMKNQAKANLVAGMRLVAQDVTGIAQNDKVKLASSGFDLASTGDTGLNISTPTEFRILDGMNNGELKFICKRVPNAIAYVLEHTEDTPTAETSWKTQTSSTREFTLKGLRSGVKVFGRIKAIGRKGQEANSDILSRVVQ